MYGLSTDQILVTKEYQSIPISDYLFEAMNTTGLYDNRMKVIHLKDDHSTAQNNHSSKHYKECHTHINDTNDSKDESQDESDLPPQLNSMNLNKIFDQEYKILVPVGPGKSTNISVKNKYQYISTRYSMSSLQRHLCNCTPTIVSTCISKEWSSTVISTCISTKYSCTHIYTVVSMEYIPTASLRRCLYYHTYTSKT